MGLTGDLVVYRPTGGVGDLITCLGGLQVVRRENPEARIHFLCAAPINSILFQHPAIDEFHTGFSTLPKEPLVCDLTAPYPEEVEHAPVTRHLNRNQIFAFKMGVEKPETPVLYFTQAELEEARAWLRGTPVGEHPVVLVWKTHAEYKNYPYIRDLHEALAKRVPNLLVFEHRAEVPKPNTHGLSIRQHAAILASAELIITPDTGWLHAGACPKVVVETKERLPGSPIFGLYGSQNGANRQAPYEVPGAWIAGTCPFGKHFCLERVCGHPRKTPPCLFYSPEVVVYRVLETLVMLRKFACKKPAAT